MYYVYLIQSVDFADQRYIGFTEDLKARPNAHNAGASKHTSKYRPWVLVSYHAFKDKRKAQEFEYYLKSGSGKAFANKRFWKLQPKSIVSAPPQKIDPPSWGGGSSALPHPKERHRW
jgi:predicted GIY-YIG superfamily endonuclease